MKNILKEFAIFALIILAIILVLGVLMYDYIPTSIVVPTTIAYETPENLKSEIEEDFIEDSSEVIITYQIDKSDLNTYQNKSSYVPGKQNPFAEYSGKTESVVDGQSGGNSSAGNSGVSDEEFFNNNKTK